MMLAEMALRTGSTQSELAAKFTTEHLAEIYAYKKIDAESTSKEDIRFQMLAYHVVYAVLAAAGGRKAVRGIKPEMFEFKWGARNVKKQTKQELEASFKAMAGIYNRG